MARSKVDQVYRRLLLTKFFVKGWGKPENLHRIFTFRKKMADKNLCYSLVDPLTPVTISKKQIRRSYVLYEGHFMSPFDLHLPGLLPEASRKAHFQMILPHKWAKDDYRPVCIQLAGTGDHGFWKRRTWMAKPLVRDYGIGSILLENPFYGLRKPPEQRRSSLLNVSDLFVMGGCLIFESMVLLHWCLRQRLGPVGLTGISMGGHMASLACCSWPRPIPLVPCLSWTTASGVFTQGVMSGAINWELLKDQYFSNEAFRDELFNLIHSPEGHFSIYHEVGQKFARLYPDIDEANNGDDTHTTQAHETPAHTTQAHTTSAHTTQAPSPELLCVSSPSDPAEKNSQESHKCAPITSSSLDATLDCSSNPARKTMQDSAGYASFQADGITQVGFTESLKQHDDLNFLNASSCGFSSSNNVNSSNNGNTVEDFLNSQNKTSNVDEYLYANSSHTLSECSRSHVAHTHSKSSGYSHLDAQSNDLNSLNVVSPTKRTNLTEELCAYNSTTSERVMDSCGGSGSSVMAPLVGPLASRLGATKPDSIPTAPSSSGVGLGAAASGVGSGAGSGAGSGTGSVDRVASSGSSRVFLSSKQSAEKFTRTLLTSLNPLSIIRINGSGTSSITDAQHSSDVTSPTASKTEHPKYRLDVLLGRYLKESTQKIFSSSSSLFSREPAAGKPVTDKEDPHLGFTPVGIRPATSPHRNLVSFKPYFTVKDPLTWEAVQFMRGIMDECTHVANFGHPSDPELIIIIQAIRDAYEPSDTMTPLDAVWPGAELRTVDAGHIEAFVLHQQLFREAIQDAFVRAYERHGLTEDWTQGGAPCIAPDEL